MGITQKDIARELGISLITVNRAFNDSGYVSEELRSRIFEYAKNNAYVPHKASQVLVRNQVRNLAVFSSSLPTYFWQDIKKGIDIAAGQIQPFNYNVRYHLIPESDTEAYVALLKKEMENGLDGAAFVNQRMYDMKAIFGLVEEAGIPYVTFNVDAPESKRVCYIGSDYRAGGRLAADFLGKTLQIKSGARILVINSNEDQDRFAKLPDINADRIVGFTSVMQEQYPDIGIDLRFITSQLKRGYSDTQIEDILRSQQGKVDAVYLVPAFNQIFMDAIAKLDYRKAIVLLHDIDQPSVHGLETRLLSAVIYQNPILQGYYTVKMLEHILESKEKITRMKDIVIVPNLILAENRTLFQNDDALTELLERP
jgi:LacI family transcriptional regulator